VTAATTGQTGGYRLHRTLPDNLPNEGLKAVTKGKKELKAMADLEQLKQKYAGVMSQIESFSDLGASLQQVDLDGEKLHVKASVPS
jgi:hypothetical protein